MLQRTDYYPTRLTDPLPAFPRRDPVVASNRQDRSSGPLDEQQLQSYERDGFLWLEGFFPAEQVTPFLDELDGMSRDAGLADSEHLVRDKDSGALRSVFNMHRLSGRFDRLTRNPRILDMVQQLLGGDVYIHQSRINAKRGFSGAGFNWHSDFETWHAEDGMPAMRAVSASLMLTDNNPFNGPLMLIPGSHQQFVPCVGRTPEGNWRQSLKDQQIGVPDDGSIGALAERGGIQAPTGPAGSLLLFECNTLHASNRNLSPWGRANLFFVYNSVENRLVPPYAATQPRPEYLAARGRPAALR